MRVRSIRRSPRRTSCAPTSRMRSAKRSTSVAVGHQAAAQQRAQPGDQLVEGERLDEVVVSARLEARHPVRHRVARGEHQDRGPVALLAKAPAHLDPVEIRHQHVQHHDVRAARADAGQGLEAPARQVHVVALEHERPAEGLADRILVVCNQHSHAVAQGMTSPAGSWRPGGAHRPPGTLSREPSCFKSRTRGT